MPNYMNNNLSVSGSEEDIKAFIHKAAEKPGRNSGILSFANFVQPVASHEDSQAMAWGCKWDAMEVKVIRKGNGYVSYTFLGALLSQSLRQCLHSSQSSFFL